MPKTRYYRYRQNVRLGDNQSLHYAQGKGYYAGPLIVRRGPGVGTGNYGYNTGGPLVQVSGGRVWKSAPPWGVSQPVATVRAPKKPVDPFGPLTTAQINARAAAEANAELAPQQAEIRRQQEIAQRDAEQQQKMITDSAQAAAKIEAGMAPMISQGYSTATQDIAGLSQGMSQGIKTDLAQTQAQEEAYAKSQGQPGGSDVSASALGDTTQALGGLFPGQSLAARGAAATAEAAGVPQIQLNAGRMELSAAMADAKQKNDDYAQQLIQLAAQFPGLKAQALDALNKYEIDKANYREQVRMNNLNYGLQVRAELASEISAGVKTQAAADAATQHQKDQDRLYKYRYAGLNFRKQQDANKAALAKKTIDVAQSKLMGYVIYKDGSSDKSIKVQQDTGSGTKAHQKAIVARNKALTSASKTAYDTAFKLRGTPVRMPKPGQYAKPWQGQYKAAPWATGKPGVFPDGSTNNLQYAQRSNRAGGWNAVQNAVWGDIAGDQLMAQYNLSKAQLLAIINRQMAKAGWRRKFSGG